MITFQFKDPVNGYIELDMNVPQERSFEGWTLEPHKKPLRVSLFELLNVKSFMYVLLFLFDIYMYTCSDHKERGGYVW